MPLWVRPGSLWAGLLKGGSRALDAHIGGSWDICRRVWDLVRARFQPFAMKCGKGKGQ